jgi:hypothetical protein
MLQNTDVDKQYLIRKREWRGVTGRMEATPVFARPGRPNPYSVLYAHSGGRFRPSRDQNPASVTCRIASRFAISSARIPDIDSACISDSSITPNASSILLAVTMRSQIR